MEGVGFRAASQRDRPRLAEIHRTAIREIGSAFYTERQIEAWAAEATEDAYPIDEDGKIVIIAEHDTRIVGVGQVNTDTPEIAKLFVDPSYSRKGLGKKLLEKLEQTARDHGADELFLDASLNATDFYHRNGYTYGTMLNKYLPLNDEEVVYPTLRMYKTLSAGSP